MNNYRKTNYVTFVVSVEDKALSSRITSKTKNTFKRQVLQFWGWNGMFIKTKIYCFYNKTVVLESILCYTGKYNTGALISP